MPYQCRRCKEEIIWLKQLPNEKNPEPKANPIEARPHPDGNLVIDRAQGLYRIATDEEKRIAKETGKNLYISHFATCKFAKSFSKKERAKNA